MSIYRRKVFVVQKCDGYTGCFHSTPSVDRPPPPALPPPRPPPPPPLHNQNRVDQQNHYLPSIVILVSCVLGSAFLLLLCVAFLNLYYSCSNSFPRRNPPAFDDDHEDFADEDHGPALDHPIWYINTVGLQQSVIESIAVFQYKRDDGLIDGTGCSVCLSEFEEDETLRLLPKCSHAFHVPCIDTWLTSHKNCPLCRAPIVCDNAQGNAAEPNLNDLGPREATRVENLEDYGGLRSHQVGEDGNNEMGGVGAECSGGLPIEDGTNSEILAKDSCRFNTWNCESRVLSDLADRRQKVEEELQPVRRSISMDASSASRIYLAVANIHQVKLEGCSSSQLVQVKKPNSEMVAKRLNRNSSIYRLMKSSSFGLSLQKGPVAMKRSFSSCRKFSLPRIYSRSQDSILPS